jgi:hypothetical protein
MTHADTHKHAPLRGVQVNKPYLPLASGDFSPAVGQGLVVLSGALALALGAHHAATWHAPRTPACGASHVRRTLQG